MGWKYSNVKTTVR